MVMSFSGIPGTEVTITGGTGVQIPNSSQTLYNVPFTGTGASQDVATVNAGKTAYVMCISMEQTGGTCQLLSNAGTRLFYLDADAAEDAQSSPYGVIGIFTTGQVIKANASAGALCNVIYVEV